MVFRIFSLRCVLPLLMAVGGSPLSASGASGASEMGQEAAAGCDAQVVPQRVLETLNALRAQTRACGSAMRAAGGPLRWDARLASSARRHAADLSQGDELRHLGPQGVGLRERLRRNGYTAQRAGENLAAGQESLDEVLQTWVTSAQHCDNLMQGEFTEVGMACVLGPGRYQRYWVLNLGRVAEEAWQPPR